MNKRIALLSAILVLCVMFAVYAQTTLIRYDNGTTTGAITTTIKKTAGQDELFSGTINNNGTTTGALTWAGGYSEAFKLMNIDETAVASAAVPSGHAVIFWDTTVPTFKLMYKDATGTIYIATLSASVAP